MRNSSNPFLISKRRALFLLAGGAFALYVYHNRTYPIYSSIVRTVAQVPIPLSQRERLFNFLIAKGNVIREDIVDPLDSFSTIQEFFTRRVKERKIDYYEGALLAPADSKVAEIRYVDSDPSLSIKNGKYTLKRLFENTEGEYSTKELASHYCSEDEKLIAISFYLAPNDYHRYHAPAPLSVGSLYHVPGLKLTVNPSKNVGMSVMDNNERVVLRGEVLESKNIPKTAEIIKKEGEDSKKLGKISLAFVAATGVGNILVLDQDNYVNPISKRDGEKMTRREVKAGQELGMFKLGSSIVMVVSAPESFKLKIKEGDKVRYGQVIGDCEEPAKIQLPKLK